EVSMRFIHLIVIAALVSAAVHVYKIKFDSTLQVERVAKLRSNLQHVRESTAALRAKWGELDSPARIQGLAQRHTQLKPIEATQFDALDRLPGRPPSRVPPASPDPIAAMISLGTPDLPTGSINTPRAAR